MSNQTIKAVVDTLVPSTIPVPDKTLIKQFVRRIYDSIKQEMITDQKETDALLEAIFGEVKDEIDNLKIKKSNENNHD